MVLKRVENQKLGWSFLAGDTKKVRSGLFGFPNYCYWVSKLFGFGAKLVFLVPWSKACASWISGFLAPIRIKVQSCRKIPKNRQVERNKEKRGQGYLFSHCHGQPPCRMVWFNSPKPRCKVSKPSSSACRWNHLVFTYKKTAVKGGEDFVETHFWTPFVILRLRVVHGLLITAAVNHLVKPGTRVKTTYGTASSRGLNCFKKELSWNVLPRGQDLCGILLRRIFEVNGTSTIACFREYSRG